MGGACRDSRELLDVALRHAGRQLEQPAHAGRGRVPGGVRVRVRLAARRLDARAARGSHVEHHHAGTAEGARRVRGPGVVPRRRGELELRRQRGLRGGPAGHYHDDPTPLSTRLLPLVVRNVRNVRAHCGRAVLSDGSWSETPDYWYFGAQAHAQLASGLLSATGSLQGVLDDSAGAAVRESGMFHIYNNGMVGKFDYGDCGPAKITATANALLFYGEQMRMPIYSEYQREKEDAADPLSMFWYKGAATAQESTTPAWHHNLPLDRNFPDPRGAWVSMRSTWVSMRSTWESPDGLFVAAKAGKLTGHQTHGHLDAGDFVLDALGERWAVELCQDDYLATNYFLGGEAQDSDRWLYYRTRTAGQNTLVYNGTSQRVDGEAGVVRFGVREEERSSLSSSSSSSSSSFWIADLSGVYEGVRSVRRGVKMLDGRSRVLIQDEIRGAEYASQWRMHTRASVAFTADGKEARLSLNGKRLHVLLQSTSADVSFSLAPAQRLPEDPPLPDGQCDLLNTGVRVLTIDIPPGDHTVAVIFAPVWTDDSREQQVSMPPLTPLDKWGADSY